MHSYTILIVRINFDKGGGVNIYIRIEWFSNQKDWEPLT